MTVKAVMLSVALIAVFFAASHAIYCLSRIVFTPISSVMKWLRNHRK
jgi:hypothetical protein